MEVDQTVLAAICVKLAAAKVLMESRTMLESADIREAHGLVAESYRELNDLLAKIPD